MIYFHNPRCSKSREGLTLLQGKKISFEIKEYLKEPLNKTELKELFSKLKMKPQEVVRKKESIFKDLKLDQKNLSDEDWIDLIIQHPVLLERPILASADKAVIGRPTEKLLKII